jgi:hypothetical protein
MSDAKRRREGAAAGGDAATRHAQPPEALADVKSRCGGENPMNETPIPRGHAVVIMVRAANRQE